MKEIKYSIDKFTNKTLDGWIFSPKQPDTPLAIELSIKNNKRVITADTYRADLEASEIGSGNHSFHVDFHPALSDDEYLSATITETNTRLRLHSKDQNTAIKSKAKKTIHLEISDLINFLRHEKRVTGIQRLVSQLCQSILDEERESNYKFCALLSEAKNDLYELDKDHFQKLLNAILSDIRGEELTPLIDAIINNTTPININDGDILFGTGASFSFQNYTFAIKKIKSEKAIKYGTIVYDLIPYHSRHTLPPELSVRFSLWLSEISSISDFLVSISGYTKKELDTFILENQIQTENTESTFIPLGSHPAKQSVDSNISSRYFIDQKFCIFVSTIETRKNHLSLVKAWEKIIDENPPQLIIVGKKGWGFEEVYKAVQENEKLCRKVTFIHDASDSDLEWLYSNCLLTLYPSLYEGWGLPVTESLSRGRFCICSNTTSLPEAGGIFADYFDPTDINDISRKISHYFKNQAEIKIKENAIKNSYKLRTWSDYTRDLDTFFKSMHSKPTKEIPPSQLDGGKIYSFSRTKESKETFFEYIKDRSKAYSSISKGDWFIPESSGRWLHGNYGSIRIKAGSALFPKATIYLKYWLPPNLKSISFEIRVNKEHSYFTNLTENEMPGHKLIRLHTTPNAQGNIEIEFIRRNYEKNGHPETRDLFISLISAAVAQDLDERIEILESLLF